MVLIRALEPGEGRDVMRNLRGKTRSDNGAKLKDHQLCNGPSKLCTAFDIDKRLNKLDLTSSGACFISPGKTVMDSQIVTATRIGLDKQPLEWKTKPWRFYVLNCPSVSVRDRHAEKNLQS